MFLLGQGADVNVQDNYLKTALHHCSVEGILDVAEVLLVYGKCDPNPKDCFQCTPLHYAAEWNRIKVIDLLLMVPFYTFSFFLLILTINFK